MHLALIGLLYTNTGFSMSMLKHIRLMLGYNTRMNKQLYEKAALLTDEQRNEDRGAFFKSVHGTLTHLVVADLIWLRRFHAHHDHFYALDGLQFYPAPTQLDEILYDEFDILKTGREQLDRILEQWGREDLKAGDLTKKMTYTNMKGITSSRNFGEMVLHMLNHQTHHRGQATTLLMQFGHDVGVTDFLVDIPDTYKG